MNLSTLLGRLGTRARPELRAPGHSDLGHGIRQRDEAGRAEGVTEAQQARYLGQAVAIAQQGPAREDVHLVRLPRLARRAGRAGSTASTARPSPRRASGRTSQGHSTRGTPSVTARGGTVGPYASASCASSAPTIRRARAVGSTTRVRVAGTLVGVTQAELRLGTDCAVQVQLPITVARHDLRRDDRPQRRRRQHCRAHDHRHGKLIEPRALLHNENQRGGVRERSNRAVLKTAGRASAPWVRIPPPPLARGVPEVERR